MQWEPNVHNYLQFLIDSLVVYEALEDLTIQIPGLYSLQRTGLERSAALKQDIQWIRENYAVAELPVAGSGGLRYAAFLRETAQQSIPKFLVKNIHMCKSNSFLTLVTQFLLVPLLQPLLRAHGGRPYDRQTALRQAAGRQGAGLLPMGGRRQAAAGGYASPHRRHRGRVDGGGEAGERGGVCVSLFLWLIDPVGRLPQACLEETLACFKFGGGLMVSLMPPNMQASA